MDQIFSLFFGFLKVIKSHKCDISNCGYSLTPPVATHMPAKWPAVVGTSPQWPSCCICNLIAISELTYKNLFSVSPYVLT